MNIYCINCKFFVVRNARRGITGCWKMKESAIPLNYLKPIDKFKPMVPDNVDYPNKEGNCKFYQRKWWKFWVRRVRAENRRDGLKSTMDSPKSIMNSSKGVQENILVYTLTPTDAPGYLYDPSQINSRGIYNE